jgi:hypothetical protein
MREAQDWFSHLMVQGRLWEIQILFFSWLMEVWKNGERILTTVSWTEMSELHLLGPKRILVKILFYIQGLELELAIKTKLK